MGFEFRPDPLLSDITLLGVGLDGHTASLFPDSPVLQETNSLVMPVIGSKPPPQCLSVTPPPGDPISQEDPGDGGGYEQSQHRSASFGKGGPDGGLGMAGRLVDG